MEESYKLTHELHYLYDSENEIKLFKDNFQKKINITVDFFDNFNLHPYTNFSEVSIEKLAYIRYKIARKEINDTISIWCEKLLRYIEIRYNSLTRRLKAQNRDRENVTKVFTQLNSLFIEYYLSYGDLRFINTSLKLLDHKYSSCPWSQTNKYKLTKILQRRNALLIDEILIEIGNE